MQLNFYLENPLPQPLKYEGQLVLTNKQLSSFYGCHNQSIKDIYRRHKKYFIEGVDYFFLIGENLRLFKAQNSQSSSQATPPFSATANALFLWTKSGALKHSQFVKTSTAKEVFAALSQNYFDNADLSQGSSPATSYNDLVYPDSEIDTAPKPSTRQKNSIAPAEKNEQWEKLKFLIENCSDSILRDKLIERAAALLYSRL